MRGADTVAELVRRQWGDHRIGLRDEHHTLTHHQVAAGAAARAALLVDLMPPRPGGEPHLGILLDNTPEYPLWLSAAALAGAAVAGINPTRRGAELARDIRHTACRVLVTQRAHLPLLDGLPLPGVRILVTDTDAYRELLAPYGSARPGDARLGPVRPDSRFLLSFTSGSTGAPKAALCSQGRLAAAGASLAAHFSVGQDDVHYICMPMFHGNAVIADWAPALSAGAGVALRARFSASRFLSDVRGFEATYFTYVGRAVQYLLATPPTPDDHAHRLRLGFGTEAGAVDAARFRKRFGVPLVEGYGSSEGGASIQRTPDTPTGAVGRAAPDDDLVVVDADTGLVCPPARFSPAGRLLNASEAVGELVNRGRSAFEGYWRNPEADAARLGRGRPQAEGSGGGCFWTGDLFYRDAEGYLYFAGRTDDRLRVDSENLAAAMIEHILARWDRAAGVAVYAIPDPVAGDQVMAALALREGAVFDPAEFATFLAAQQDLGTKMPPRFVRVMPELPLTATNKIHRAALRRASFLCADPVWWRPTPDAPYERLTPAATAGLRAAYARHDRTPTPDHHVRSPGAPAVSDPAPDRDHEP
ncbi:AMP-binding protein [Streptomyces sp. YH02]|uniref:AMP-binding protein n=1 Tax=Streptomyces sp. YH02 TaxID=3256999 RepID=UPI003757C942